MTDIFGQSLTRIGNASEPSEDIYTEGFAFLASPLLFWPFRIFYIPDNEEAE